jgi:hypothetical protein
MQNNNTVVSTFSFCAHVSRYFSRLPMLKMVFAKQNKLDGYRESAYPSINLEYDLIVYMRKEREWRPENEGLPVPSRRSMSGRGKPSVGYDTITRHVRDEISLVGTPLIRARSCC